MSTTTTTWRDYADQLTPEQITDMENYQAGADKISALVGPSGPESLVRIAEQLIEENEAQRRYAHIPVPAEAITPPSRWSEWDAEIWMRGYIISEQEFDWSTPDYAKRAEVRVLGEQSSEGTVERTIDINGDPEAMTAAQAKQLAEAILAAVEAVERLNGDVPPFM